MGTPLILEPEQDGQLPRLFKRNAFEDCQAVVISVFTGKPRNCAKPNVHECIGGVLLCPTHEKQYLSHLGEFCKLYQCKNCGALNNHQYFYCKRCEEEKDNFIENMAKNLENLIECEQLLKNLVKELRQRSKANEH